MASDAFASNIRWHKQVGENEVRLSWFLRGEPGIAMVCTADLSESTAALARRVYERGTQAARTHVLSRAQVLTLRKLVKSLTPSIKMPEVKNLILVSVLDEGQAKMYLYNRLDPPRDIIRLYDLTGAYLSTDPVH